MADYYTLSRDVREWVYSNLNIPTSISSDSYLPNPVIDSTKKYIDEKLRHQAERTYDIISGLIQWNIDKEEFVKLLLSDEEG